MKIPFTLGLTVSLGPEHTSFIVSTEILLLIVFGGLTIVALVWKSRKIFHSIILLTSVMVVFPLMADAYLVHTTIDDGVKSLEAQDNTIESSQSNILEEAHNLSDKWLVYPASDAAKDNLKIINENFNKDIRNAFWLQYTGSVDDSFIYCQVHVLAWNPTAFHVWAFVEATNCANANSSNASETHTSKSSKKYIYKVDYSQILYQLGLKRQREQIETKKTDDDNQAYLGTRAEFEHVVPHPR